MDNNRIKALIESRERTHNSIYSDIGNALESVPTADLTRYFVEIVMGGNDNLLRSFVEEKIIAAEINKERYGV